MSQSKTQPRFQRVADVPSDSREMPVSPIAEAPTRTARAKKYEEKISTLLHSAMKATVSSEKTVADAAALITHGPMFASKAGDLADADAHVRKMIDFITSGSDNPYAAFAFAAIPLAVQIMRNHEVETPVKVGVRIPFTKRTVKVPFRFKLRNPFLRSLTTEPKDFTQAVFGNPVIQETLRKQNIEVAWSNK